MATDKFRIAKDRRAVVIQKFLDDDLNGLGSSASSGAPLVFMGRTTDATPTEIYIGGKLPVSNTQVSGAAGINRLYLPDTSCVIFQAYALAYNVTDANIGMASWYRGGVQNVAGTVSAIKDYDSTTGGTQAFIVDPAFATVAVPLSQGLSYATGTNAVSFAADDTNDALTVTVTGTAAKTINWKVYMHCYTISLTSDRFYGDSAAGVGT